MKESENYIEEYIITALLQLMEEKPFEAISVSDIAKKSGRRKSYLLPPL